MVEWASDDRVPTRAQLAAYSSAATETSRQETGSGELNMAGLKDDDAKVNRLYDRYDVMADIPARPGDLRVPTQSIAARIANLAQQVTQAADLLDEARVRHRTAAEHRSKCEAAFHEASEALFAAVNEHREGTPENVPYQP